MEVEVDLRTTSPMAMGYFSVILNNVNRGLLTRHCGIVRGLFATIDGKLPKRHVFGSPATLCSQHRL